MDLKSKTLEELSDEWKKKKYITLETASKISGYTKDYIERLCRLNKVDFRLKENGEFVVEIETILKETHTILLSYDGINFVDTAELTDPTPQIVGTILSSALKNITVAAAKQTSLQSGVVRDIPHFGNTNYLGKQPAVSALAPVSMTEEASAQISADDTGQMIVKTAEEEVVLRQSPVTAPFAFAEGHSPKPNNSGLTSNAPQNDEAKNAPQMITRIVIPQKPVNKISDSAKTVATVAPPPHTGDEWDSLLFGDDSSSPDGTVVQTTQTNAPAAYSSSPYRPITTSVDPSVHHDPAPLFPPIGIGAGSALSRPIEPAAQKEPNAPSVSTNRPQEFINGPSIPKKKVSMSSFHATPPPISLVSANGVPQPPLLSPSASTVRSQGSVPTLRVMPVLAETEEHALERKPDMSLLIPEQNAIVKRVVAPLAFAFALIGVTFFILHGLFPGEEVSTLAGGIKSYFAAVGDALSSTQMYQR